VSLLVKRATRRSRAYLLGMLLGVPSIVVVWFVQAGDDVFVRYGYPFLAGFLLTMAWTLLRRPDAVRVVERRSFVVVTTLWLARMAVDLFSGDPAAGWQRLTPWSFMALPLMAVLGYVVFETRQALRFTSLIPVVSGLLGVAALAPVAVTEGGWGHLLELLRYEVYLVVTMVFVHVLAMHKDDAAASQLEAARMRAIAHHDELTALPNRRRLTELLELNLAASAEHGRPVSVIAFDLDHFKEVNDVHGHAVGDRVLQAASRAAAAQARPRDTLGRWGGEEFLVIVPGVDRDQAAAIAERMRRALASQPYPRGVRVTASFGVAQHRPGDTVEELLAVADAMLYEAKASGRDVVCAVPSLPQAREAEVLGSAVEGRDQSPQQP
jgi:diguanylate cyclase (GGDEF)-like protein